jgi:hypothetical protein
MAFELGAAFERVARELAAAHPEDGQGHMLRAPALKTAGCYFAFAAAGDLVVKLPESRVQELIARGEGAACDPRGGRPMREWVRLQPADEEALSAYVHEARGFVAGLG